MHELAPWFRPIDIIIAYLKDVEGYKTPEWAEKDVPSNRVTFQLHLMGYPKKLVYHPRFAFMKHLNFKDQLPRYLAYIKAHTPLRQGITAPTGISQITF
jgi:hypothetical protein